MDQSEVLKFEQEQRTWKLSEAIRAGAKLRPKCRMNLFHAGRSCALGAAYEAIGGGYGMKKVTETLWLSKIPDAEKAESAFHDKFGFPIVTANDDKRWTREQIADELEKLGY
jgi:hypothetical protein